MNQIRITFDGDDMTIDWDDDRTPDEVVRDMEIAVATFELALIPEGELH